MAIDFPDSPTLNDTFTVGDRTWTWDGTRWEAVQTNFLDLNVSSPLSYTLATQSLSIDLSTYDTSTEVDGKISTAIDGLIDSAPATLDTLNELAAALEDDANFAATVTNAIGANETDISNLQLDVAEKKTEVVVEVNSDITLVSGRRYLVDTSAARNLTLPASPTVGDEIQIFDVSNLAGTNNIVVDNNTNNINGILDTLTIDANGAVATLVYTGATLGWRI